MIKSTTLSFLSATGDNEHEFINDQMKIICFNIKLYSIIRRAQRDPGKVSLITHVGS